MATEIIKKNNGKVIMKFHAKPSHKKKFYTENFINLGEDYNGFHCIIYTNNAGQIAQYSPVESGFDMSLFYHRPASEAMIKDMLGMIARTWKIRVTNEAIQAAQRKKAEKKDKKRK